MSGLDSWPSRARERERDTLAWVGERRIEHSLRRQSVLFSTSGRRVYLLGHCSVLGGPSLKEDCLRSSVWEKALLLIVTFGASGIFNDKCRKIIHSIRRHLCSVTEPIRLLSSLITATVISKRQVIVNTRSWYRTRHRAYTTSFQFDYGDCYLQKTGHRQCQPIRLLSSFITATVISKRKVIVNARSCYRGSYVPHTSPSLYDFFPVIVNTRSWYCGSYVPHVTDFSAVVNLEDHVILPHLHGDVFTWLSLMEGHVELAIRVRGLFDNGAVDKYRNRNRVSITRYRTTACKRSRVTSRLVSGEHSASRMVIYVDEMAPGSGCRPIGIFLWPYGAYLLKASSGYAEAYILFGRKHVE
ncbi:hypothetical protein J6590_012024 [Homalodisca vitripennis]|nr:hypothetical protein J6590_012024 [Homalodisca vitripennis]